MSITELQALDALARVEAKRFPIHREALVALRKEQGRRFIGIVGPRGVGKTVILKQLAMETDRSFYGSIDTFKDITLKGGISLTQVHTTCSIPGYGRLSPDAC